MSREPASARPPSPARGAAPEGSVVELAFGTRTHGETFGADPSGAGRLREWLRAQGLRGDALDRWTEARGEPAAAADADPPTSGSPAEVVAEAQGRLDDWLASLRRLAGAPAEAPPNRARLRRGLRRHPELFLDDRPSEALRALAAETFASGQWTLPPRRMSAQPLTVRAPRWLFGMVPALVGAAGLAALLAPLAARDGLRWTELCLLALWTLLVALGGQAAFVATWGAWSGWRAGRCRRSEARVRPASSPAPPGLPRTAIAVPIYQEAVAPVFARVAALRESLLETPGGRAFEIFVLSDTRDPLHAAAEERAWRRVVGMVDLAEDPVPGAPRTEHHDAADEPSDAPYPVPVYYRRRRSNVGKKAGNVQHFCERWGHRYAYFAVFDADSLMSGEALVRLVRRLEAQPTLGLLQAPVSLVRGQTPFARALQFSSALVDPLFLRGLGEWSGDAANYYGHNAMIRTSAFLESGGLPSLAGPPPLGGHILSHDFVEAAFIRRGGHEVRFAPEIQDSFEEPPPDPASFLARDRRWSQGNFQHLRVFAAQGLHPMSRIHLLLGALAYLTAPLGLVFVGLAVAVLPGWPRGEADRGLLLGVLAGSALLLVWPRLLGVGRALFGGRERRRGFGGLFGLLASTVGELATMALLAPRMAVAHTGFTLAVLAGRAVTWGPSRRRPGASSRGPARGFDLVRRTFGATLLGLAVGGAAFVVGPDRPELLAWLAPLWAPLLLAAPIDAAVSSRWLGEATRRLGLFATPVEGRPPPVLRRARELEPLLVDDAASRFRDVVLDPVLNEAYVAQLRREGAGPPGTPPGRIDRAVQRGPAGLSREERARLLADPEAIATLHRVAWRHWPVEAWNLGRQVPAEPPSPGRR
jgi:membrane glycosyltransferase